MLSSINKPKMKGKFTSCIAGERKIFSFLAWWDIGEVRPVVMENQKLLTQIIKQNEKQEKMLKFLVKNQFHNDLICDDDYRKFLGEFFDEECRK